MAGMLSYTVGGLAMLLVGVIDSLSSFFPSPDLSSFRFLSIFAVSSLSLLDSGLSLLDSHTVGDDLGFSLQLCSSAVFSLVLLYSLAGISSSYKFQFQFPSQILDLLLFFALITKFLLFRFQFKDIAGGEHRYYDLVLVPVAICAAASLICASPLPCRNRRFLG